MPQAPDVRITPHGSIFIFELLTESARAWVTANVLDDHQTWGKNGLVVEHRYAHGIAEVMSEEGLVIA